LDDLLTSFESRDEASIAEKTILVEAEQVTISSTESKATNGSNLSY
jgi:hypothetical protein